MRKLSAAAATASRPGLQTELSICGTLNSAEAFAAVAPPPGSKLSTEPTGAIMTGIRIGRPKRLELVSIFDTFRSTRGRNAIESIAIRLSLCEVSEQVPPRLLFTRLRGRDLSVTCT